MLNFDLRAPASSGVSAAAVRISSAVLMTALMASCSASNTPSHPGSLPPNDQITRAEQGNLSREGIFIIEMGRDDDGSRRQYNGFTGPFPHYAKPMSGSIFLRLPGMFEQLYSVRGDRNGEIAIIGGDGGLLTLRSNGAICYEVENGTCEEEGGRVRGSWWLEEIAPYYVHGVNIELSSTSPALAESLVGLSELGMMNFEIPVLADNERSRAHDVYAGMSGSFRFFLLRKDEDEQCRDFVEIPVEFKPVVVPDQTQISIQILAEAPAELVDCDAVIPI